MFSMWLLFLFCTASIMFGANKFLNCNFFKGTKLSTTSLFHIFRQMTHRGFITVLQFS